MFHHHGHIGVGAALKEAEIDIGIRPIAGGLTRFVQPVQRSTASLKHFIYGLFVE
jgi:hypothetical protein